MAQVNFHANNPWNGDSKLMPVVGLMVFDKNHEYRTNPMYVLNITVGNAQDQVSLFLTPEQAKTLRDRIDRAFDNQEAAENATYDI